MCAKRRTGFTLVEVLIVVVIMAILAATIIPQFSDSSKDAKVSSIKFNLHTLRAQIELYKSQHDGRVPSATLAELITTTDRFGTGGTGAAFPYGPYMRQIPPNPFNFSNVVRPAIADPPTAASGSVDAGWLYHAATGKIWIDEANYLTE